MSYQDKEMDAMIDAGRKAAAKMTMAVTRKRQAPRQGFRRGAAHSYWPQRRAGKKKRVRATATGSIGSSTTDRSQGLVTDMRLLGLMEPRFCGDDSQGVEGSGRESNHAAHGRQRTASGGAEPHWRGDRHPSADTGVSRAIHSLFRGPAATNEAIKQKSASSSGSIRGLLSSSSASARQFDGECGIR